MNAQVNVIALEGSAKEIGETFANTIIARAGDIEKALRFHMMMLPHPLQLDLLDRIVELQMKMKPMGAVAKKVLNLKKILACDCPFCVAHSVTALVRQGRAKDRRDAIEQVAEFLEKCGKLKASNESLAFSA